MSAAGDHARHGEGVRPRSACAVYLDDLQVHAPAYPTALANLHTVIDWIKATNLCLNPKKCHLLCTEMSFLGYVMGPNPAKVASVKRLVRSGDHP
ncbi:hypothetical protein AAFF_G00378130 [Aldrovandia affinis]|uniref:ribonuclease H n=1 Tax=Aldrovandia affinis TaxID=143900 RepID=A0AAD7SGH1_9TELE|nr:hypothetical protein AAFF_G00378130 [Aldrovandia affinis]